MGSAICIFADALTDYVVMLIQSKVTDVLCKFNSHHISQCFEDGGEMTVKSRVVL